LGHTTGHADLKPWSGTLENLKAPDLASELLLRLFPDATGIEHHQVGSGKIARFLIAGRLQGAHDAIGIVVVHLTPEGDHRKVRHIRKAVTER
jgi:hypothetical protein